MFKNAGSKIKIIARSLFIGNVIVSIFLSLYLVYTDNSDNAAKWLLIIPIVTAISAVISIFLYAFGDMCENIDLIRSNIYTMTIIMEKRFPDLAEEDPSDKADDGTDNKETNHIEE